MDEYTEVDTSGRTRKWILQGGAAGGLILVGSVLLAFFSPIGATPAEPAAESQACEHAHQRPGEMQPRLDMGKGHDMGAKGARPAARMGAALGGRVAEFLEMDRQELGGAVRGGASIADLAGDRVDELVADLVARATERIEQAVTDGRLDRDRADEILARVEERITARLNGGQPTGPAGS